MNIRYVVIGLLFVVSTFLFPDTCAASTNLSAGTKGSWIVPTLVGIGATALIIAKTMYNNIGPKYGGRIRNDQDVQYWKEQQQKKLRSKTQNDVLSAFSLLPNHRNQPSESNLYSYHRKRDEHDQETIFELCSAKDVFSRVIDPLAQHGKLDTESTSGGASHIFNVNNWVESLSKSYQAIDQQTLTKSVLLKKRLTTEQKSLVKHPWQRIKAWAAC
jgi:hypothetical protein